MTNWRRNFSRIFWSPEPSTLDDNVPAARPEEVQFICLHGGLGKDAAFVYTLLRYGIMSVVSQR